MRITALVASHNRRELTLASLTSFFSQSVDRRIELDLVLVDDGSSDGTGSAVESAFPRADVLHSSGNLYWAAGMALAERHARAREPDYLLWLNDDVILVPDALARMLEAERSADLPCIVVGALNDPLTGEIAYSGVRRRGLGLHPFRVELVQPRDRAVLVETFNGNVVLVPRSVSAAVGSIDGEFAHALADFDYGLRAAKVGVRSVLAPGTVGTCANHVLANPWLDPSLPMRTRLRLLLGPKGFPPRSAARYLRQHGGLAWPVFWIAPYVRQAYFMLRSNLSKPRLGC